MGAAFGNGLKTKWGGGYEGLFSGANQKEILVNTALDYAGGKLGESYGNAGGNGYVGDAMGQFFGNGGQYLHQGYAGENGWYDE